MTHAGKTSRDENFPVGSVLLTARLRPHVAIFYRLAREADDIADSPALDAGQKLVRLDRYDRALRGELAAEILPESARAAAASAAETGVSLRHATDLLAAFRQDAVKERYDSWGDLMAYCALSASPVGRFLLDLHGENEDLYRLCDPLCDALQVMNHLQDLKEDYRMLGRVYLPADWMSEYGASLEDLGGRAATPGLRAAIDRCLDGCEALLNRARNLPAQLHSRRLAMETAVIVRLADRLLRRLREEDPIAGRVNLSKIDFALCGVRGIAAGFFRCR